MTERGLKIATIGGGSSYTPELIEGFIKRIESLPVKDIYLVDIDAGMESPASIAARRTPKAGLSAPTKQASGFFPSASSFFIC